MDSIGESRQDGLRHATKARVMGKLFGREKKVGSNADDVSGFLHGTSDKLFMVGAPPPMKIDTSKASRWPTAAEVNHTRNSSRGRSASPKRSRKGLIVRFTERQPEIIGEGGDEAEAPPSSISQFGSRSQSHPPMPQGPIQNLFIPGRAVTTRNRENSGYNNTDSQTQEFRPSPVIRSQTGIPNIQLPTPTSVDFDGVGGNSLRPTDFLRSESIDPSSYAARVHADMRAAEGRALLQSTLSTTIDLSPEKPLSNALSDTLSIRVGPPSPGQTQLLLTTGFPRPESRDSEYNIKGKTSPIVKPLKSPLQDTAATTGFEEVKNFSSRMRHLFKLFELSAESVMPLGAFTVDDYARGASWWFLKGRTSLESAARNKPSGLEGQRTNEHLLQQGHMDLAKALWIVEDVVAQRAEIRPNLVENLASLISTSRSAGDEYFADALERCQSIYANLQKLSVSMKRNGLLPPLADEAILPQGFDTTIWIKYPSYTPDIPMLLSGKPGNFLGSQVSSPPTKLSDALPLGDTAEAFFYARMYVDVYLMEERVQSQQFRCPCVLSICRAQTEEDLAMMIASQTGLVTMNIQSDKTRGPTWSDINWGSANSNIEVKLTRGFVAIVQFSSTDFKNLWNMYDYTMKMHAMLLPRQNEEVIYENILEAVQYFDRDPQSRVFPKVPVPNCQVRLMEKKLSEVEGTGARSKHRGYRIAIITHQKTKQLNGISHELPSAIPTKIGLLRGESGAPALLLKFDDATQKSTIVLSFDDVEDRGLFHKGITGGIRDNEIEIAYLPIKKFSISSIPVPLTSPASPSNSKTPNALDSFEWQHVRVINRGQSDGSNPKLSTSILSENLRIIIESRSASITDRINVAPGELKICLDNQPTSYEIIMLRAPQEDMTVSLSEAQMPKETPAKVKEVLSTLTTSQTLRRYRFSNVNDLHTFQAAVTGFSVLFDGLAESFAISRRRMAVPIYKKWEAANARVQILRHDKVLQLAAFFEGFSHGDCMNFTVKATDVFESFNRGHKFFAKIVDAKFALPKGGEEKYEGIEKSFICLDMPDYPGEHDDITISFDTEADRDKFAQALPAPVKVVSRLGAAVRR